MPFPPPPPPPPPPPTAYVRRDDSFDTDLVKRSKSAKNKTTKGKLSKKEQERMEKERLEKMDQLDMEMEIRKRMDEILKKKEQKGVRWRDESNSDESVKDKKPKKEQKKKKMTKKEKLKEIELLEKERLEKLRNMDAESEIEKRVNAMLNKEPKPSRWDDVRDKADLSVNKMWAADKSGLGMEKQRLEKLNAESEVEKRVGSLLNKERKLGPSRWNDVKVKEDLRVNRIWTTDKARLDMEKERLDRELEKFDKEKEMERKMSEILTRKDPWRPNKRDEDDEPKLTSVQGRVREAVLRQEREAQEKIQMEKERKERAERRRITQERERLLREQRELERIENERVERELLEKREREIREMVRKQVEEELRKIPRERACTWDRQCHNLGQCCIEFAANSPIEGCPGLVDKNNSIIEK